MSFDDNLHRMKLLAAGLGLRFPAKGSKRRGEVIVEESPGEKAAGGTQAGRATGEREVIPGD